MKQEIDIEQRAAQGVEFFKKGYNCAQSVVLTFADIYGLSEDLALRISASFGGGIGRMRLTCGAASGMFILAGLENGTVIAGDTLGRGANYQLVQNLAHEFEKRNGSLICATLLGIRSGKIETAMPSQRTLEYYSNRPCSKMVEEACRIYAEHLNTL
ncbi:MAG: C-GCAxxG-C-C family protein [Muribaculaceae bacterium]